MASLSSTLPLSIVCIGALVGLLISTTIYVVYYRFLHPLAKYPGPFWASLTNLWEVREWVYGRTPYTLAELHAQYGPVVRYGPNKVSVTSKAAVQAIYIKGAKTLVKTDWYNPFGHPNNPNLFNQRNVETHVVRRRLLLKSFSPQVVETYEPLIDKHLGRLQIKIRKYSDDSQVFDLKRAMYLFMCDVMGDLILSRDFNIQESGEDHRLPDDHAISMFGTVCGAWPAAQPILGLVNFLMPHPRTWKRKPLRNTLSYFNVTQSCVKTRLAMTAEETEGFERQDILSRLIQTNARTNEKGEQPITQDQLTAETFAFLFAGVHPPSATMNLLFWQLLHHPHEMERTAKEIEANLPLIGPASSAYSNSEVEARLPYLKQCVKEGFRITPVFTQPLPRYVTADEGLAIDSEIFPKGTSIAMCNHAFHHDVSVWGDDSTDFDPSRWNGQDSHSSEKGKYLMHFSAGSRQCIGKVLATSIIYKLVSTVLSEFAVELADPAERRKAQEGGYRGALPKMKSVGISDLVGELLVTTKRRVVVPAVKS